MFDPIGPARQSRRMARTRGARPGLAALARRVAALEERVRRLEGAKTAGAPLGDGRAAARPPPPGVKRCPGCGLALRRRRGRCAECGLPLDV
jgi:hypothetical protein